MPVPHFPESPANHKGNSNTTWPSTKGAPPQPLWGEGKGGRKRGRETSMCGCLSAHSLLGTWPTSQACALTGNRTGVPLVRRVVLNRLSHTSQGVDDPVVRGTESRFPAHSGLPFTPSPSGPRPTGRKSPLPERSAACGCFDLCSLPTSPHLAALNCFGPFGLTLHVRYSRPCRSQVLYFSVSRHC